MSEPLCPQDAPRIDSAGVSSPEVSSPEIYHVLARIRGKLARRLYAPGTERDVADLVDLLTDYLVIEEASLPPSHDWARIRPAEAWHRVSEAVGLGRYGDPLTVAERVESLERPTYWTEHALACDPHYTETLAGLPSVEARLQWVLDNSPCSVTVLGVEVPPSLLQEALDALSPHPVPDEWGRHDMATEIQRARINLARWHPTDERGQVARQDLERGLSALVRADAVIRAAQADLVAAQERGAELERALDHERCLLQTDEDGMDDGSGEAITRIEKWDDYSPVGGHALFAFVRECWWSPGWGISAEQTEEGVEYHLSTGGWSENEVIVDALQRNRMVHLCWWQSSRSGGHYVYLVPTVESA